MRGAAAGRVPSVARTGARAGPSSALPRDRPVCDYRRRRRQPPSVVAPPELPTSLRRDPKSGGAPVLLQRENPTLCDSSLYDAGSILECAATNL